MAPKKDLTIHKITNPTQWKVQYQYLNCFQNNPSFPNIICLCNYIPIPVPLCPVQLGSGWTWRNADLVGFHPWSINIIPVISSKKVTSDNLMRQHLLMSKGSKVLKPTFMRAPPNPALNIARIPSLSPSSLAAFEYKCLPTNPFLWVVVNNVYSVTPSTNKRK